MYRRCRQSLLKSSGFLIYCPWCNRYFFFFQAEDGIRDWSVTGVQTCALPISSAPGRGGASSDALLSQATVLAGNVVYPITLDLHPLKTDLVPALSPSEAHPSWPLLPRVPLRSEERRVGKECRSVWSWSDDNDK